MSSHTRCSVHLFKPLLWEDVSCFNINLNHISVFWCGFFFYKWKTTIRSQFRHKQATVDLVWRSRGRNHSWDHFLNTRTLPVCVRWKKPAALVVFSRSKFIFQRADSHLDRLWEKNRCGSTRENCVRLVFIFSHHLLLVRLVLTARTEKQTRHFAHNKQLFSVFLCWFSRAGCQIWSDMTQI